MMQPDGAPQHSVPWDDSRPTEALGGPQSDVFRATSTDGSHDVAVRLWCGASAKDRQAAKVRAECARYVSHPNLAAVEACEARGNAALWIVSEYVRGPSLETWAASGRVLPLPAAIDLVRNLSLALYAAQREGLTHHALQPRNIIVTRQTDAQVPWLDAKLLNLSVAAWMSPELPNLYNAHFIAPETLPMMLCDLDASDAIDDRTNVYSCGALLYMLVTGSPPFHSQTFFDLSNAQLNGKLLAPEARNSEISSALQTVILSALAVDPTRRYANCGELASVLAAAAWRDGYAESYEVSTEQPLPLRALRVARMTALRRNRDFLRTPMPVG
jgi:serine/threonine protein kinase